MSKIVKGIGRAVSRVVRGIGKLVKNVMKSPIGKILVGVGLSMIGGPMLAGAIKGASAGSGFLGTISGALSGAASGFQAAIGGIGNAVGTMASQGIGAGMKELGAGMSNNFGMGGVLENAQAALNGGNMVSGPMTSAVPGPMTSAVPSPSLTASSIDGAREPVSSLAGSAMGGATEPVTGGFAAPRPLGALEQAMSSAVAPTAPTPPTGGSGILDRILGGIKEYKLGPSMLQTGGYMLAGAMQGKQQEEQRKWEERQRQDELERMYDSYRFSWRVGPDGRYYQT